MCARAATLISGSVPAKPKDSCFKTWLVPSQVRQEIFLLTDLNSQSGFLPVSVTVASYLPCESLCTHFQHCSTVSFGQV